MYRIAGIGDIGGCVDFAVSSASSDPALHGRAWLWKVQTPLSAHSWRNNGSIDFPLKWRHSEPLRPRKCPCEDCIRIDCGLHTNLLEG
jgi:hypothetical protein